MVDKKTRKDLTSEAALNKELREKNKELAEAQKQYQTLFDNMLDGISRHEIICDKKGKPVDYRFLSVNSAFERLTGLKAKDIIGKTVMEVMPKTEKHWIERFGQVAITGKPAHFENYSKEIDKYFEVTAFQPAPMQFACTFSDVTERKKSEEELEKAERQSRTWLENSPVCTKIVDLDLNLKYMSPAGVNALKFDSCQLDNILNKPYPFDSYPEPFKTAIRENLEKAKETGKVITQEVPVFDIEGNKLWFHSTILPVNDDDGNMEYIMVVSADITDRKEAEAFLKESEEHVRLLIENMGDTVSRHLPDSTITYLSPSCETLLGYKPKELLNLPSSTFVHPQDIDNTMTIINNAISENDNHYRLQHRLKRKDGTYVWVETDGRLIYKDDGSLCEIQCNIRDISERKRLQLQEKALQEKLFAAERQESLGVLAGGVAHDLNNILGPILFLPEMVDEVLQDVNSATDTEVSEARKDLEAIASSAQRGSMVVRDLKALGRRGHVDTKPLDANEMIKVCLETNDYKVFHKKHPDVELESVLHTDKMTILGDANGLHRILLNLIMNAEEAIQEKGHVKIETTRLLLKEKKIGYEVIEPGDYVVIHVRDTGVGIHDDILKRIFDPFVSSKKGSSGPSGSGLGLAVVLGIVKDHNGYVDLERDSKEWATTFSLYFPVVTGDIQQNEFDVQDSPPQTGSENVLVVDDEQSQRFIVGRGLEKLGYTVTEAENGHEALKIIKKSKIQYDLIILDMIMEKDFDGLDAYKEILKIYPDQKVIISSGHAPEARGRAAKDLGADWLSKPYSVNNLAMAVRKRLDRE